MLTDLLQNAGLSSSEAQVYESVLLLGQGTPVQISIYSKTSRENTYKILEELEDWGLVTKVRGTKKLEYVAESPKVLLDILEKKKQDLKNSEDLITQVVSEFNSQLENKRNKPVVQFLTGSEGVKYAYMKSIEGKGGMQYEILHRKWDEYFRKWMISVFVKERTKRGIAKRIIIANNEQVEALMKTNKSENRESVVINTDKFPLGAYIVTYKDKLFFVMDPGTSIDTSETILIEHKVIAESIQAILELIWEKQTKKKLITDYK